MQNKWIIRYGKVNNILDSYLLLEIDGKEKKCLAEDVSDYEVILKKMFTVGRSYKFSIVYDENNQERISYKIGRPKLLKKRPAPTATLNGFKNINNTMHQHLKEYKVKN